MAGRVGCAILAAGASRRFGSPKQLAPIAGEPMLRRAVGCACASRAQRVAVVLGAHAGEIWPVLVGVDIDRIDNPDWNEGLSSSIRKAATWARQSSFAALLLALADQPNLHPSHLDQLIDSSAGGERLAASRYAGVVGVPAVFPSAYFVALDALRHDVGARELLRRPDAPVAVVDWPGGAFDLDERPSGIAWTAASVPEADREPGVLVAGREIAGQRDRDPPFVPAQAERQDLDLGAGGAVPARRRLGKA